jgi:asparagine synthase (glutamine-hydrolysing)
MPGIAGVIDFNGTRERVEIKRDIEYMSDALSHTSPCSEEVTVFDNGAFAAIRLEVYRLHGLLFEDKTTTLAFWGYIWDQGDLKKRLGLDFGNIRDVSIGQLLLQLYNKEGGDGLCNLNGRFVIAIWNKVDKVLNLVSDRYGFCKLFYWVTPQRILFASEYKAIIWHEDFPKKIDQQAMADFMTLGYSTGDRTFFENIKLLPPASVATFKVDGNLSIKKYWDYSFYSEDDPLWLEEDYVDQFFDTLKLATERQVASAKEIAIPLSGGYDSRTLSAMVDKINFHGKIETFSFGNPCAFDVVYGRKISKNLGFKHNYIPIESTYLRDNAERFVWLMEGSVDCLNAHMLLTYPLIKENRFNTVMTGFFGDIICGSAAWIYSVGIRGGTDDEDIFRQQYAVHANIMKDEELKRYIKEDIYKQVRGNTFDTLRSQYFKCPSKSSYFRSRYFSTHERQRRYTSFNLYIFDFVSEVVSPFLDTEFADFAYHIPPALAIYQNIYHKMIVKHLPKVASVPHNETRLPLNASWVRKGLHWRWERLNRNLIVRATIGRRYVKMNDNYLNTDKGIRTGSRDFIIKHISGNPFLADYFNMDRIHQMLDDHMSGKSNEYGKITALLTLSLWHKLFIEGKGFKDVEN